MQIGVGRSGHIFSFEASGITPDIIAMAKGLAGGFPVGAVVTTETVAAAMTPGSHGSTFGGNPLAMAVARAVLNVLENDGFMADVRRRAEKLREVLRLLPPVIPKMTCRGGGMLLGLVLAPAISGCRTCRPPAPAPYSQRTGI